MAIQTNSTDKCPHCGVVNRFEAVTAWVTGRPGHSIFASIGLDNGVEDKEESLIFARCTNQECRKVTLLFKGKMIEPLGSQRPSPPMEVPKEVTADYNEACLVEPLSKKASAALARRCLQNVFHHSGIKNGNLNDEIDDAIKKLPTHLADDVDAIRVIGNFAAHPEKYLNTGQIVDVEPHEAEYLLDTLWDLFEHYFVRPAKSAAKRAAINAKLKAAGKTITLK